MRAVVSLAVAGVSLLLALPAMAQSLGDMEKGRALAERQCAVCHLNPGQGEKHGASGIPGFQAIADRPGQNHEAIVKWLRSRPPMMPDHHLTWDEADALAEFIMSMRKK
jgi:cytochrome c